MRYTNLITDDTLIQAVSDGPSVWFNEGTGELTYLQQEAPDGPLIIPGGNGGKPTLIDPIGGGDDITALE